MTTTETSTGPTEACATPSPRTSSRTELRSWRLSDCLPRMLGWCPNPRSPQTCGDIPRTACCACPGTSPVTAPETVSTFGAVTVLDGHDGHGRSPSPDMNVTVIVTVDVRPDRIDEFVAGITTNGAGPASPSTMRRWRRWHGCARRCAVTRVSRCAGTSPARGGRAARQSRCAAG
jgi:hypothetical protein